MAITYDTVHQSNVGVRISPALANLSAINESFQQEGISVLNEGFSEVVGNQHFYSDYVAKLSEGMDPQTTTQFETLARNTRTQILQESAIDGVNPVTALSLPILRVAFPKTSIREGFPTEPVLQPKFKVTWLRPYVVNGDTNEKIYLPKAVKSNASLFKLKQLTDAAIPVGATGAAGVDLVTAAGGNVSLGDAIDPNFRIVEVTFKALDANGANAENKTVRVDFALDTNINVVEGSVTAKHSDGTVNEVRVFAKVDRRGGKMDVVGLGREVVSVKILGYLSSEANNRATQVGFDIDSDETVIGTGHPIESPINIQHMTDVMAMYNIDATVRTLEIMSNVLAQSVDLEGVAFLAKQWELSPQQFKTAFDVTPPANYALGNTAWREELKIKIDNLVTRLMQSTNITAGQAVIFGNPIDTQVLHNVRWTYAAEEQPNGVNIEYKVGSYTSGVTTYKVLSSFNFESGSLFVAFLPSAPDQQTLKYYPYSFNVIRGAASPNSPLVPSVSMLKRHAFKEYSQMVGKIEILNNNGQ